MSSEAEINKLSAKKRVVRAVCIIFAVIVAVTFGIFGLFLHTPSRYRPAQPADTNQVSPYLTHYLAPGFYENLQLDKPFDVIVEQEGLNDIIARWHWRVQLDGLTFSAPAVVFGPQRILLMATVELQGMDVVLTISLQPRLDDSGQLILNLKRAKAGAIDITLFAKKLTTKIISEQIKEDGDNDALLNGLSDAILHNQPVGPIFSVRDRMLRLTKIAVLDGKLSLSFEPQ